MALLSTKAALKLASILVPKDVKKGATQATVGVIITAFAIPIIFVVALFTSGSYSDDRDNYEKAFDQLGCDSSYYYQLEDIRFFDYYTLPPNAEEQLSVDILQKRMEQDYFKIKQSEVQAVYPSTGTVNKKVCLLREDEEIFETLHSKYNVDEALKTEVLESIRQLRNGRQNFIRPISASISQDFSTSLPSDGIEFTTEQKKTDVVAIADGTVIDIKTENDTYLTMQGEERKEKKKGLTITIEHTVIKGINRNGEYDYITMYSTYSCLSDVNLSVGDEVTQGQVIAKTANKDLFFTILDTDKKPVNPNDYIFFSTGKFAKPLDDPFTLTSPIGDRDLGYHFGNDFVKEFGASIYSITDGEVVEVNSTCNANPPNPSTCPTTGSVQWGGNYVVIKADVEGTTYYIQYAHMKQINASVGQTVYAGQCIGFQGNSGNSYGSHVHIEAHTGGINTANKDTVFDVNEWLSIEQK